MCRREYGADFEPIIEDYDQRVEEADGRLKELDAGSDDLATEREQAEAAVNAAERAAEAIRHTTGPDTVAEAEVAERAAEQEELNATERRGNLDPEIERLERTVKAETNARVQWERQRTIVEDRAHRLTRALTALDVEHYDAEQHELARARAEECSMREQEAVTLRERVAGTANIEGPIAEEQTALETAKAVERAAKLVLGGLDFEPGGLDELRAQRKEAEEARDTRLDAHHAARSDARASSQAVQDLRSRLEEAKKVHDEIAVRQVAFRQHQVATDLLNSFRTQQAQRAWPRLEQGASELLDTVSEGRYADVRLSEDYRIVVVDRGEEHGLSRYSGGEQDLANLCLRLAIADWVARERGVEIGFVVLDEVFGSQDETRRHNLLDELRRLSERFRQLFVITHLPDIADLCDQQLDVTLADPGRSHAELLT